MELRNSSTGLGWNERRVTIEADDAWWNLHCQKYPKHAKWHFAGLDKLKEMEVMFDKAYVTGHLSTPGGPIDLGSDKEMKAPEEEEGALAKAFGDSSTSRKQKKGKDKRKRSSLASMEERPYF